VFAVDLQQMYSLYIQWNELEAWRGLASYMLKHAAL